MELTLRRAAAGLVFCLALGASAAAENVWVKVKGGSWEPSPKMIAELKAGVEPYVKDQAMAQGRKLRNWREYTFQYQGQEESERKSIFINALCIGDDRWHLDREMVIVLDGGSCFFNVKYDPARKQFYGLSINGGA